MKRFKELIDEAMNGQMKMGRGFKAEKEKCTCEDCENGCNKDCKKCS
jgi:hypothetical protein